MAVPLADTTISAEVTLVRTPLIIGVGGCVNVSVLLSKGAAKTPPSFRTNATIPPGSDHAFRAWVSTVTLG